MMDRFSGPNRAVRLGLKDRKINTLVERPLLIFALGLQAHEVEDDSSQK